VRVRAFAKINLSLRVLGTRPDGFHELRTLFQSIALHDTLTVRRRRGALQLTCDDPRLPVDGRNLIVRAARAVWKASGRAGSPRDVWIDLAKRIPPEAGLGGGSSDAVAALRALGRMWHVDEARLRAIAPTLGADVPFFMEGGTVLGLERGDVLVRQPDLPSAWVVLALPDFGVSTAEAFGWWDADRGPRHSSFDRLRRSGTSSSLALSLSKGELRNDLQKPVAKRRPAIARIVTALRRAGASHAAMSGSGSAVFGLFARKVDATRAARAISAGLCPRTLVTRTLSRAACRRARPGFGPFSPDSRHAPGTSRRARPGLAAK
jgi:4-diphosphocytidyl-2-C-methyl-D-erythritol kinase